MYQPKSCNETFADELGKSDAARLIRKGVTDFTDGHLQSLLIVSDMMPSERLHDECLSILNCGSIIRWIKYLWKSHGPVACSNFLFLVFYNINYLANLHNPFFELDKAKKRKSYKYLEFASNLDSIPHNWAYAYAMPIIHIPILNMKTDRGTESVFIFATETILVAFLVLDRQIQRLRRNSAVDHDEEAYGTNHLFNS